MTLNSKFGALVSASLLSGLSIPTIVLAEETVLLDEVVVTATREEKSSKELAATVGVANAEEIKQVAPAHPAELLNRTAGVYINNLGGEGHMTSIRQPITTKGVYLFLEDGLPTRPTGFFNHNGLYEVNIPQAERIEVTKGPGSALYGSEAIGGIINSMTKPAPDEPELTINPEVGAHGWSRLLVSGGAPLNEETGYRLDLNLTDVEGYRDESEYSRYSSTLRVDGFIGDNTSYKTIASYTQVDQSGVSSLEETEYYSNPKTNHFHGDIGAREVDAFRLSTEFSYEPNSDELITITPFYRHNKMSMMPSWMVTYDPNIREYEFQSLGMMSKYRVKSKSLGAQFILGLDVDYTPSTFTEEDITMIQDGDTYTGYNATGTYHYDYDADQTSISPYVHSEWQLSDSLLLNGGLRYDYFDVSYDDNLNGDPVGRHNRPESQSLSYDHLSPKLGAIYKLSNETSIYANYHNAFRAPSVGQLFRSGSSTNTAELDSVKADSFEIGLKGDLSSSLHYNLTFYYMMIEDDIVSIINGTDRNVVNAGETLHKGIELNLMGEISKELNFDFALAYTEQEYDQFQYIFSCYPPACIPPVSETRDYAGFDVGKAPETKGNLSLTYRPSAIPKATFELEYEHLGEYFTDETNTAKYKGHDLVNLRANYQFNNDIELYSRLMNVGDVLYSSYTSNQVGDPDISYRPGLPRSLYVGFRLAL